MPGAGKSSVGRGLAKRMGVVFLDSDAVIEQRLHESIRNYFEREGEARFRDMEQAVMADLCAREEPAVLATGGGAVLREANRAAMAARGVVVYLHASAEELFRRLHRDTRRPLLQASDPRAVLERLYVERDPIYRQAARFVIETGRPSIKLLVDKILMQLDLSGDLDLKGHHKT